MPSRDYAFVPTPAIWQIDPRTIFLFILVARRHSYKLNSNRISIISGVLPRRIGGPQVPEPQET